MGWHGSRALGKQRSSVRNITAQKSVAILKRLALTERKEMEHSVATAFASSVFPVPAARGCSALF